MEQAIAKRNSRIDVVDVLRGFAVIGIIILHSIEYFSRYLGIIYNFIFGIVFVLLQMIFTHWWLSHFKHGPFEGIWKRLT